jgi:hypothetical protein
MRLISVLVLAFAFVANLGIADAQPRRPGTRVVRPAPRLRMPSTGSTALGANFGLAAPSDSLLDMGLTPNVNVEYYVTPRLSIRGQGGAAWTDFAAPRFGKNVRPAYFDGNLVYNWEHGAWHPFTTGGVGIYHYHVSEPPFEGSTVKPGFNGGGGIEYFLSPRDALKVEGLYHGVSGQASGPFAAVDTSFWTATFGFKRYF